MERKPSATPHVHQMPSAEQVCNHPSATPSVRPAIYCNSVHHDGPRHVTPKPDHPNPPAIAATQAPQALGLRQTVMLLGKVPAPTGTQGWPVYESWHCHNTTATHIAVCASAICTCGHHTTTGFLRHHTTTGFLRHHTTTGFLLTLCAEVTPSYQQLCCNPGAIHPISPRAPTRPTNMVVHNAHTPQAVCTTTHACKQVQSCTATHTSLSTTDMMLTHTTENTSGRTRQACPNSRQLPTATRVALLVIAASQSHVLHTERAGLKFTVPQLLSRTNNHRVW
jgi:hypothetical protein